MTTSTFPPAESQQYLIDQRLDALDQLLLGLLPRNERLATVAQVEKRIREVAAAGTNSAMECATQPGAALIPPVSGPVLAWHAGTARKRSRLAVTAGALGVAALVLLIGMPVS